MLLSIGTFNYIRDLRLNFESRCSISNNKYLIIYGYLNIKIYDINFNTIYETVFGTTIEKILLYDDKMIVCSEEIQISIINILDGSIILTIRKEHYMVNIHDDNLLIFKNIETADILDLSKI